MLPLLASNWFLDPIVAGMGMLVDLINTPIHNYGISLIIIALLLRLVFWPLNVKQFKSMMAMQKMAPKLKKLQEKYKSDPQKLQTETMAAYKEAGANPLSGCLPMLIQYPFLFSVFYLVNNHKPFWTLLEGARDAFGPGSVFQPQGMSFLWIGSDFAKQGMMAIQSQPILATSLAHMDIVLLVLYAISMYITVRYGSMPATDPQQAQTQKMMSFMSPLMLGYFGFRYTWPSALTLYWLSSNLFTMAQQFYLLRRFHEPLAFLDSAHVLTDVPAPTDDGSPKQVTPKQGSPKQITGSSKKKKAKGTN